MRKFALTLLLSAVAVGAFAQNPTIEELKKGDSVQFEIRKDGSMAYLAVRLWENNTYVAGVYFGPESEYSEKAEILTVGAIRGEQLELSLMEDADAGPVFYVTFPDGRARLYMEGSSSEPITMQRKRK
jgi:hypothetical protein